MGKKIVLFLVIFTIAFLIAGWFGIQYFIDYFDIERATSQAASSILVFKTMVYM